MPAAAPNLAISASITLWTVRVSTAVALASLAATAVAVVSDPNQYPPRRPTPAESAAAAPGAKTKWAAVYARLETRLGYSPLELGAVWASRSGRICGTVRRRDAGIDFRTHFYTEGPVTYLAGDDLRRYFRTWIDCVGDHWVDLRIGSDETGFCAADRSRKSAIAALLCRGRQPG
jgi:hypothetical protein